jgi:hypothetical protein
MILKMTPEERELFDDRKAAYEEKFREVLVPPSVPGFKNVNDARDTLLATTLALHAAGLELLTERIENAKRARVSPEWMKTQVNAFLYDNRNFEHRKALGAFLIWYEKEHGK